MPVLEDFSQLQWHQRLAAIPEDRFRGLSTIVPISPQCKSLQTAGLEF
jgi:hypothetical protein